MSVMRKPFGSREFGHELFAIAGEWLAAHGPESLVFLASFAARARAVA